jgi:hypothetical protein
LTYLPSFNHVKGIDIPINKIPATNPPKILDELEEDEFESESELSESEDPPLLLDPSNKSSASDIDDSASASN